MTLMIDERLQLEFDDAQRRRWIAGRETIIHCHHYNSRIQNTVEGAAAIDGKGILISANEAVYGQLLAEIFEMMKRPNKNGSSPPTFIRTSALEN